MRRLTLPPPPPEIIPIAPIALVGKNYLMVGDAFAFIDPVFSTGVYMAMRGAFLAADTVVRCLEQPRRADAALKRFDREVRRALGTFSWYIYRINKPALRDLVHGAQKRLPHGGRGDGAAGGRYHKKFPDPAQPVSVSHDLLCKAPVPAARH